jgi:predicted metal-binding protein
VARVEIEISNAGIGFELERGLKGSQPTNICALSIFSGQTASCSRCGEEKRKVSSEVRVHSDI